jgi:hypothetical protein
MTVLSSNYSSIEDAWGYLNPELQPKNQKKKKNKDPICELYNSKGSSSVYTDTDLVAYTNKYNELYNKSDFQNPVGTRGREVNPKNIELPVMSGESKLDLESSFDFQPSKYVKEEHISEYNPRTSSEQPSRRTFSEQEAYTTDEEHTYQERYHPRQEYEPYHRYIDIEKNEVNYLDLALYVISGIILIFLLEQFVKLGELLARQ